MKTLILMRHCEAGNSSRDFLRPLTEHGRRQAADSARQFADRGIDHIFASAAQRTTETARTVAAVLGSNLNPELDERLYECGVQGMLYAIHELDDEFNTVLLIAHNPTISSCAYHLSRDGIRGFSPGSFAHLEFDVDSWKELAEDSGRLETFYSPF